MCWSKSLVGDDGTRDTVIVVVNLDPHGAREAPPCRWTCRRSAFDWDSRISVTTPSPEPPTTGECTTT
jgi:hypothetical protein